VTLQAIEQFPGRSGVGGALESHVDQDVGVDEDLHRYFRARAV
jgi:hypothetical protein